MGTFIPLMKMLNFSVEEQWDGINLPFLSLFLSLF